MKECLPIHFFIVGICDVHRQNIFIDCGLSDLHSTSCWFGQMHAVQVSKNSPQQFPVKEPTYLVSRIARRNVTQSSTWLGLPRKNIACWNGLWNFRENRKVNTYNSFLRNRFISLHRSYPGRQASVLMAMPIRRGDSQLLLFFVQNLDHFHAVHGELVFYSETNHLLWLDQQCKVRNRVHCAYWRYIILDGSPHVRIKLSVISVVTSKGT